MGWFFVSGEHLSVRKKTEGFNFFSSRLSAGLSVGNNVWSPATWYRLLQIHDPELEDGVGWSTCFFREDSLGYNIIFFIGPWNSTCITLSTLGNRLNGLFLQNSHLHIAELYLLSACIWCGIRVSSSIIWTKINISLQRDSTSWFVNWLHNELANSKWKRTSLFVCFTFAFPIKK